LHLFLTIVIFNGKLSFVFYGMNNDFFSYLQQLEAMAFFSGYPLLFAIVMFIAGNEGLRKNRKENLIAGLSYAYGFVGILYWGLQLKDLSPNYSIEHISQSIQQPYLVIWGLCSVLFLMPVFSKITVLSLLHSLVFFFFLLKDIYLQSITASADKNIVRNDMKIYTGSLLLNLSAYALIMLAFHLFSSTKKRL
jgi:hypothetical protein